MPSLSSKYKSDDRLPVLISGNNNFKLLGIPIISKSASDDKVGSLIGESVYDLVYQWQCAKNVVAMVCDTTSSNTGHLTAACIALQQKLEKHLLWFMCRHHVGELIVSHVFKELLECSKAPEVQLFVRLQKVFDQITNSDISFAVSDPDELPSVLQQLRSTFLQDFSDRRDFPRDDYKEFMDLVRFYLRDDTFQFKQFLSCGPVHHARWMAKCIYLLKVSLLSEAIEELPAGTVLDRRGRQMPKIERFVKFVSFVYAKWWFNCSNATAAPVRDLQLLKDLDSYREIDAEVACVALKAFKNHLWYLTAELVPLALFGNDIDTGMKQAMVDKILQFPKSFFPAHRFGAAFGKPRFPTLPDSIQGIDLTYFVGEDSWFFFATLNLLDDNLLLTPVSEWEKMQSYQRIQSVISKFSVTNDAAERGVKLAHDKLGSALKETRYQNITQVVEHDRAAVSDLRVPNKK